MRRTMVAVVSFLLVVCILAGCSEIAQPVFTDEVQSAFTKPQYDWKRSDGETLLIWSIYPELERGYIKKAFQRYEELTGGKLEIVQIPKDQFEQQVKAAFTENGKKPDVLLSYGGTNITAFDPDKNFYDFSGAPWVGDLTDTSINQTIFNGKIIGLPHWEASISGTLYNKQIFEKYNLKVPKSQKEFMKLCEELQDHGITPVYLPAKEISMLLYQFPLDSVVEDRTILNGLNDGSIHYADIPEMKQIVSWYRTMAQRGYFGETYLTDGWNGMNDAMNSGGYAMMLCWDTWLYTDFKGDPSKFGLMPAFVGVPEYGTFEGPNLGLFIVNKNSEKLDAALNFITFLADPFNYNVAFEGIYTAPVFKNQVGSISTPQYLDAERLIERNFRDSTAVLRISGFSQMDAVCILDYMSAADGETAEACLEKMDIIRNKRLGR